LTRRFGYLVDKPDPRDAKLGSLLGAQAASPPPASASVWDKLCPIRDQGYTQSCVGHAWSRALRLAYLRAGFICPELSPLYAYALSRAQHGGEHEDVGTYLRTCAQGVVKFGAADDVSWPFVEAKVNVQPSLRALHNGYDRKGLRHYARIDSGEPDDVRRAIAAGHPVVAGWQISQSFVDWNGDGVIGKQREPFVGGHALAVVSYAADGTFTLANSWTDDWGHDGFAVVAEAFIRQADDVWAVSVTT
jgi:Papain family cysteine protease